MSLKSGYNVVVGPNGANLNNYQYITNDFDRVQVWDGLAATTYDAGIAAPVLAMAGPSSTTTGLCTTGVHLLRYRYLNSLSPGGVYRSNPSGILTYTVSGAGAASLTFTVGVSGNIVPSTDPKVDSIVIEMTAAAGTTYYIAATISNAATTTTLSLTDVTLIAQTLATADTGNDLDLFGHEQPPIGLILTACRDYAFLGGTSTRTSSVTVTNNSTTITRVSGGAFSDLWGGRLIRIGTDTVQYEIATSNSTTITLLQAYAGSSATPVTATIASKTPNRIYWSKQYFPESWKPLVRARDMLAGRGDVMTGMADFMGDLWIFGRHSIQRLVFIDDPANGELDNTPGEFGVWNQRCLIGVDGALYGWGPNGVWMAAGRPRWISRPIDTSNAGRLSAYGDLFHGAYDPVAKTLTWWYVDTGDTTPKMAMSFDLAGSRWILHPYRQAISASCVAADGNGKLHRVALDSVNGKAWYHEGITDGVPSASNGSYTADTGCTTTSIPVTQALPTTGNALSQVVLYRPATDESVVIASNTASIMTTAAFATAPAAGESLYAGSIPWEMSTGWFTGAGLQDKKRPVHLAIKMIPSTAGSVRVYIYTDFSTTPYTFTNPDAQQYPEGVTVVDGSSYITVALTCGQGDGFVPIPMPEDWTRSISARITNDDPAGTLAILDLKFAIEDRDEEAQETAE